MRTGKEGSWSARLVTKVYEALDEPLKPKGYVYRREAEHKDSGGQDDRAHRPILLSVARYP